ncbi:hypothetical protein [Archangium sp.]|uniref:hypothetical protein n=1 Tax=Archangium sp. TaxID=1872627 RepID=UPI002D72A04C|nr:hypothetical protein [Archangium sp.]HYO57558.1 hypothetical protein [Archangium sp.]
MKYFCEACERLVPPATFRVEDGLLVVKCSRCKVEMRCGPEQDGEPAPVTASKSAKSAGPVIMLAGDEAEPDPIENEPTRRIAVPAGILAAIEKVSGPAKTPAPRLAMSEAAAASNQMALRLSEEQSRVAGESAPPPAATEPEPAKASSTQLHVVSDSAASPAPAPAAAPSSEDPFMPPPGFCPKCIGVRKDGAVVCPYCGLDYARFRVDEFRPSPVLSSTWLGVQEHWESKGAHDKVLALASERGELAALGRLYRIRLARQPEDTLAKRGREEVLRLASASSTFLATPPPDKRTKMRMAGLGLLFLLLVVAAVLIGAQVRRMLVMEGP